MNNKGLRIDEQDRNIFYTVLKTDEDYCNKLNWKILFFEGTYTDEYTIEFEEQVRKSTYGIDISLAEVKELLNRVNDLWGLLLIGQCEKSLLVKSDDDAILFNSSDVVIEYFDSSYWTITSINSQFIENAQNELGKIYDVTRVSF